ncbi:hypothetical protein GIB67_008550, partial [Kingdonia uniflora]
MYLCLLYKQVLFYVFVFAIYIKVIPMYLSLQYIQAFPLYLCLLCISGVDLRGSFWYLSIL